MIADFPHKRGNQLLLACTAFWLLAQPVGILQARTMAPEPLTLGLAPVKSAVAPVCDTHGNPAAPTKSGRPEKGRAPEESEHRPQPLRKYFLSGAPLSAAAWAKVLRADGSNNALEIERDGAAAVSLPTPLGEGPCHGGNNVYVVDQQVTDGVLEVRSAKWLTLHHNCAWGHDHKFDQQRQTSQHAADIPFEIVIDSLWDKNFHSDVRAGEPLTIKVFKDGQPVKGAKVMFTTAEKWQRQTTTGEDGASSLLLVDDYFVEKWPDFKPDHRGNFSVTAELREERTGLFQDQPYTAVHYTSTFSWKYSPAKRAYNSYAYGLLIGALFLLFSGAGIYLHRERRQRPFSRIKLDE